MKFGRAYIKAFVLLTLLVALFGCGKYDDDQHSSLVVTSSNFGEGTVDLDTTKGIVTVTESEPIKFTLKNVPYGEASKAGSLQVTNIVGNVSAGDTLIMKDVSWSGTGFLAPNQEYEISLSWANSSPLVDYVLLNGGYGFWFDFTFHVSEMDKSGIPTGKYFDVKASQVGQLLLKIK